jgi:hypothetical protein
MVMIEAPKITEEQQKQLRYDFIKMIEEYGDQDALDTFRTEWDGTVNFKILSDNTVVAMISGEEKLPPDLKEKTKGLLRRFNEGNW